MHFAFNVIEKITLENLDISLDFCSIIFVRLSFHVYI